MNNQNYYKKYVKYKNKYLYTVNSIGGAKGNGRGNGYANTLSLALPIAPIGKGYANALSLALPIATMAPSVASFVLLKQIAQGGQGRIFEIQHVHTKSLYILKIYSREAMNDTDLENLITLLDKMKDIIPTIYLCEKINELSKYVRNNDEFTDCQNSYSIEKLIEFGVFFYIQDKYDNDLKYLFKNETLNPIKIDNIENQILNLLKIISSSFKYQCSDIKLSNIVYKKVVNGNTDNIDIKLIDLDFIFCKEISNLKGKCVIDCLNMEVYLDFFVIIQLHLESKFLNKSTTNVLFYDRIFKKIISEKVSFYDDYLFKLNHAYYIMKISYIYHLIYLNIDTKFFFNFVYNILRIINVQFNNNIQSPEQFIIRVNIILSDIKLFDNFMFKIFILIYNFNDKDTINYDTPSDFIYMQKIYKKISCDSFNSDTTLNQNAESAQTLKQKSDELSTTLESLFNYTVTTNSSNSSIDDLTLKASSQDITLLHKP